MRPRPRVAAGLRASWERAGPRVMRSQHLGGRPRIGAWPWGPLLCGEPGHARCAGQGAVRPLQGSGTPMLLCVCPAAPEVLNTLSVPVGKPVALVRQVVRIRAAVPPASVRPEAQPSTRCSSAAFSAAYTCAAERGIVRPCSCCSHPVVLAKKDASISPGPERSSGPTSWCGHASTPPLLRQTPCGRSAQAVLPAGGCPC